MSSADELERDYKKLVGEMRALEIGIALRHKIRERVHDSIVEGVKSGEIPEDENVVRWLQLCSLLGYSYHSCDTSKISKEVWFEIVGPPRPRPPQDEVEWRRKGNNGKR